MRTLLGIAALAAVMTLAARADAAPCCMSASSGGFGRLVSWEKAVAGLQLSSSIGTGYWNADGEWFDYRDYRDHEWRATPYALVRTTRRGNVFAAVPLVLNSRRAGDIDDSGFGLGDASAGYRHELLSIGERFRWPAIALSASVVAPTGRAIDAADGLLAADATGRGSWVAMTSVSVEVAHVPWFVKLDLGAAVPLPYERADTAHKQRYGESVTATISGGLELVTDVVASLSFQAMREAAITTAGERVDDTARTDLAAGLGVSWKATDHVTFTAGATSGIFVDGGGDNQLGRLVGTIGVRYGVF